MISRLSPRCATRSPTTCCSPCRPRWSSGRHCWSPRTSSYYWSHRCHHVIRVLWASHVVHHSSTRFNLSTALRQTLDRVHQLPVLRTDDRARRAAVHPGDAVVGQSALPVLDPHRAHRPDVGLVRGGLQHAVAPPRAPRVAGLVPGPQLRRHPDHLGQAVPVVRAGGGAADLRPDQEHRARTTRCGSRFTSGRRGARTCAVRGAWREAFGYTFRAPGWQPPRRAGRSAGRRHRATAASRPRPAGQTA